MEWTYKVRNSWTLSAMETKKVAEDGRNKGNINNLCDLIMLQTQSAFFLSSQSKHVILDSY